MSRLSSLVCASSVLLAACGAKQATATAVDPATLIRGSWSCDFAGKDITNGEQISGAYSVSYVSDGTWAASGVWKSVFEKKSVELGIVGRGTWTVSDGKLEEKSTFNVANWGKLGGETFDHGQYNRAMSIYFRENPDLDPLKRTMVTTFSELTPVSMAGADQDGVQITCERPKD
jgi:hypothetical protein